jgi:hypothetical protein
VSGSPRVGILDDGPDSFKVCFLVFAELGAGIRWEDESAYLGTTVSKDNAFLNKR